jgi:hypothetical protein
MFETDMVVKRPLIRTFFLDVLYICYQVGATAAGYKNYFRGGEFFCRNNLKRISTSHTTFDLISMWVMSYKSIVNFIVFSMIFIFTVYERPH